MSASRDKTQKIAFVYSNLYQIYRQGKEAASSAPAAQPTASAPEMTVSSTGASPSSPMGFSRQVLKTDDLKRKESVQISDYRPAELIGKRVPKPEVLKQVEAQNSALDGLKKNLADLNDLQARLRFMLQELEDLVKE